MNCSEVLRADGDLRRLGRRHGLLLRAAAAPTATAREHEDRQRGREPPRPGDHATAGSSCVRSCAVASGGSVNLNVLPLPGSLSAQIRPPCCSTIRSHTASPMPVPGYAPSPCRRWNGSKNSLALHCPLPLPLLGTGKHPPPPTPGPAALPPREPPGEPTAGAGR